VVQLILNAIESIKPSKKDWIFLKMANGYGDMTHAVP
jgi:hypothetical protein